MREGWTYKKLGEVCDFQGGSQPPKDEWIKEEQPGYVRMLQIRDFTQSRDFEIEYVKYTKTTKLCNEDDILLARYGASVGKILTGLKGAYNVAIMKTIPNQLLLEKSYLHWYLKSEYFQSSLFHISQMRAAQSGFGKDDIFDFQIPLPPKSQQEAIVSELDEINSLLALKREQLQKYDKLAQSLFYEMFGDPVENEKGWEVKKVSNVCSVFGRIGFRGYTKADFVESPEEGAISLSPTNIINNSMDYKKCSYVTWDKYHESPEIKARIGDILLVKTGSSYGKCALITCLPHKATINPQFVIIKNITINNRYLHYYLSSEAAKICYDNFVIGTAVPTFSQKNLNNMAVLVPPLTLQQQFASRIEHIESQKQQVQAAIEKLETLLASRMQYWFD